MKKSAYLIPASIAVVCQMLVISVIAIVTVLQNPILTWIYHYPSIYSAGKMVIPSGLITAGIMCFFYLLYLIFVIFYQGRHRRVIAGVFLGLTLLTVLLCNGASTLYPMLISGSHSLLGSGLYGTAQTVKLSALNNATAIVTLLPSLFTTSMYYISLGRFGMSDPEKYPVTD